MRPSFKIYFLILVSFYVGCSDSITVSEQDTAEILKILASDDLKGRHALSSEITKAEDFIAAHFQSYGLEYANDEADYFQSFRIKEVSILDSELLVNGNEIDESRYFGFFSQDDVFLSSTNTEIVYLEKGKNFRSVFNEMRSSKEDKLVIVDSEYDDIFGRYQSYYSQNNRIMEGEERGNILFLISDEQVNNFSAHITASSKFYELRNVVGIIKGKRTDEIVIFSAHHDHIGIRTSANADSIANGANDNASGVTAVIQLANYFSKQPQPERTLMFVTFTAEEMGGFGSRFFSKKQNPDDIVAMFNIEMIGKPAVSGPNTAWITGYDRSTFGEILSASTENSEYEFYADPYPNQGLFYRSDNAVLARLGVPAHSISTTPIDVDPDYHEVSDEYETIDISHLNNTITAIAKAAETIVSAKATPTRVDTTLVD
ncbi:MAG: M28 family peptidase [Balneolaceae bacterium]|nr:M28 family peptidase [Balneolaceae bacterium]